MQANSSTASDGGQARSSGASSSITSIHEYLTFKLGAEEYGMDIRRVQELRSYEKPTRIAHTAKFLKGVINLRGVIAPIIDMRLKLSLPEVTYNSSTVVIVINVDNRVVGLVVDGVSDVITLQPEQLRETPDFSSTISNDHVLAIGALEDRMLILLDIEKLMTSPEMGLVEPVLQ